MPDDGDFRLDDAIVDRADPSRVLAILDWTGQRVLVAAGPLAVDQRHLPIVEDDAAGADRQGGDRAGVAVPGDFTWPVLVLSELIPQLRGRSAGRSGCPARRAEQAVAIEAVIAWLDAGQPDPAQAAARVRQAVMGVIGAAVAPDVDCSFPQPPNT